MLLVETRVYNKKELKKKKKKKGKDGLELHLNI